MDSRKRFLRSLILGVVAFTVFFAAEFFIEWWRLGHHGLGDISWAGNTNAKLVDVLSPMARAYNNILAMLIATIGLAIPLTANMHTPKLIEMFLRDRTNQIMLVLCAFAAANVLFVDYMIGPHFAPVWAYRVAIYGALLGWAAIIPYFFYVVRFLDPSNILTRLKNDIVREVDRGVAGDDPERLQDLVHERLQQIGTIVLKSIDRADRSVVTEGIWALKLILDHYGKVKAQLPAAWFKVDRKDFVGLSADALEFINEDRTWFEYKVMHQMFLAYQGALAKSADAISAVSDATRVISGHAAARHDEKAVALIVRYVNNYLREAIKKKDTHAIYDIFYQYRLLGRDAGKERPDLLRQIGHTFRVYADMAAASGLPFTPQMAAFDLGWLVRRAYDVKSPAATDLLDDVLGLEHLAGGKVIGLIVKAKLVLGGFFVESGLEVEARRVRDNLAGVSADTLARLGDDLLAVKERERREKVRAFLDSCKPEVA